MPSTASDMMVAAFVKVPGRVRIDRIPVGPCESGQVRVRIACCGLCGSDFIEASAWAKDWKRFGHEMAGTVAAIGPDVSTVSVGDRVVVSLSAPCGQCPPCREGRPRYCSRMLTAEQGGFGQYVRVDQRLVFPVPDDVSDELACLAEPITVVLDALAAADASEGDALLVVGGGFLGSMAMLVGAATGLTVAGLLSRTLRPTAAAALTSVGGEHFAWQTLGPKTVGPPQAMAAALAPPARRLIVLHTAPACHIRKYVAALPYNASIVNLGLSASDRDNRLRLDAREIMMNRTQLLAGFPVPCMHFPRAIELLAANPEMFLIIETQQIGLDQLPAILAARARPDRKILVRPS